MVLESPSRHQLATQGSVAVSFALLDMLVMLAVKTKCVRVVLRRPQPYHVAEIFQTRGIRLAHSGLTRPKSTEEDHFPNGQGESGQLSSIEVKLVGKAMTAYQAAPVKPCDMVSAKKVINQASFGSCQIYLDHFPRDCHGLWIVFPVRIARAEWMQSHILLCGCFHHSGRCPFNLGERRLGHAVCKELRKYNWFLGFEHEPDRRREVIRSYQ